MQAPAEGNADSSQAGQATTARNAGAASRGQTVVLQDSDGGGERVVEVNKLTPAERKLLVKGVLTSEDQDQEQFLTELRARLDRAGIEPNTCEVRYENLHIEASAYVGGRALPTVLNSYLNFFEGILLKLHLLRGSKKPFVILENMSGVIHPGRMTLLLGPPGSGKSTLLQALAGKYHHNRQLQVGGSITYNGHSFDKFVPVRTASYVTQNDTHLAELTVRETFDFSARCQGPGSRPNILQKLLEKEGAQGQQNAAANSYLQADTAAGQRNAIISDYIIRILGLDVCSDIPVGSEMIRGISGGQKKRVTTGEMLVGPQQVLFMDEISTGLDSSTTYQIVKCLRDFTHLRSGTVLMALLQPAPEVYDLFDDVLLMSEGRTIFHGPKEDVVDFFTGVGFRCPPRKGIPDFLQEVSSPKDQQQYWIREEPWKYVPGDAFVEAYSRHRTGQNIQAHLAQPFDQAKHKPESLITTKFALNGLPALRATLDRELVLMSRTFFVYIFKAVQMGIVGIVVATMFLRTHIHSHTIQDANLVSGMLFFSLIQSIFAGIAEMTFTIERLPTFFKHRDTNYFPTWAFVIPTSLTRLPASAVEALVYTLITYFAVPLSIDAGRFFLFLLILFLLHNMAITLFRMVGALTRNIVVANALGSLTMLLVLMMGGFVIPKQAVHPWVVWLYWADPLQYAQRGFEISQMTSKLWTSTRLPGGMPLGDQELIIRGFSNHFWWVWICIGALIVANIVFHIVLLAAAQFLGPYGGTANIQSEESLAQREYAKHGGEGYNPVSLQVDEKEKSRRAMQLQRLNEASRREAGSRRSLDGGASSRRISDKALQKRRKSSRDMAASRKAVMESGDDLLQHKANGNGDVHSIKVAPLDGPEPVVEEMPGGSFREPKVDSGMTLPFQPMTLTFTDMHYYVKCPPEMSGKSLPQVGQKNGKEMLELLQGISGAFRPAILTCLMGVSGAGKTTLMDVLAGRKTGGLIEGDIRLNGHPKEQKSFARVSGYVEQFDIHSPRTTVREALQFSADLRFNGNPGRTALRAFVDEVMDLVELHPNRDALVGAPGVEGLSVEQRKRLTIAVELVANPSIVFMDEPTSGLDARAAAIVMRTVRNIVNTGRTIVCTIHQPSIDIFESFDELLLLKSGGRTIYAGNLGQNSMDLIKYFQGVEGAGSLPAGLNPATWMLQVTTPGNAARLGIDFADYYEGSALRERMDTIIAESSQPHPDQPPLVFDKPYARGIFAQYLICVQKFHMTFWRNPEYNQTRFSFSIAVALFFGACFWYLGGKSDSESAIYSTLGALLVASLFLGILNSIFVQPVIASERQVFYRERAAGMYDVFPWYLGMATVEAGYLVLQTILYVVIVYWMAGFISKPAQFFWFLLFNLLTLMYFTYYGVAAVACTPNLLVAAILSGSFYGWWLWLYYINPVTWTLYGLVGSNLGEQNTPLVLNTGQMTTAPQFLYDNFHYKHDFIGWVVLILIAFVAAFWAAGWAAFRYLNFNVR